VTGAPDLALLHAVLGRARDEGLLGPAPVAEHIDHADRFLPAIPPGARIAELGSGAGVPGLVLAVRRPDCSLTLVESSQRRADHLRRAVGELALGTRVAVDARPAELVGRDPAHRGQYDVVVARSFGPPATTAECGAPLLRVGGSLLVSEPPDAATVDSIDRWAWLPLPGLPLRAAPGAPTSVARLEMTGPCDDRFPRGVGVPRRRPLTTP
jgi:16S rRNA (guanine527-N7)-methyltransferase